jgi:hypothetical protein
MSQTVGRSRSTIPRRDIEHARKPIGWDTELVEKRLSSYQQEGPAGRIGVQWQRVAKKGAMPSMTGISALLKAARDGKRIRRGRQHEAKAAADPLL